MLRPRKEKSIENSLKRHLAKKYVVEPKQYTLPPTPFGRGRSKPDILAHKGNKLLVIEVKKAKDLRTIGQAFGQIATDKFLFQQIDTDKKRTFLERLGCRSGVKVEFIVAFDATSFVEKDDKKEINMKLLKHLVKKLRIPAYLVSSKDSVKPINP